MKIDVERLAKDNPLGISTPLGNETKLGTRYINSLAQEIEEQLTDSGLILGCKQISASQTIKIFSSSKQQRAIISYKFGENPYSIEIIGDASLKNKILHTLNDKRGGYINNYIQLQD